MISCKYNTDTWLFLRFQILEKWANLRLPLNVQKPKVLLPSYPWPREQGLCPWTSLGVPPPDNRYRLMLPRSPWHGAVPPLFPDVAGWNHHWNSLFLLSLIFHSTPLTKLSPREAGKEVWGTGVGNLSLKVGKVTPEILTPNFGE